MMNTWTFTIFEENESGYGHMHGILAIRNITDYNKNIKNNILTEFKEDYSLADAVIKDLNTFKDIKGWIRYLHKDTRWIFRPHWYIIENYKHKINEVFLKAYTTNYNLKNEDKEDYSYWNSNPDKGRNPCIEFMSYDSLFMTYLPFNNFIGIKLHKNE